MQNDEQLQQEATRFKELYHATREAIGKTMVGQDGVIEGVLTALFAGGNVLLEGVPGLGKTELVKTMASVLELHFRRVQFTPDLMPADIIGTNIMTSGEGGNYRMEFRRGPIFTQLLLADEINRATPKTQSALLEAMQEGSVTVGGHTYHLDPPFFVMATQNPLEQEGTYPLPEAQLDRFMFKIDVPFLNRNDLNEVVERTILKQRVEPTKVLDRDTIMELRTILDKVVVAAPIRDFAVRLVLATHPESEFATAKIKRFVRWGASPRAAQALIRAGRVRALADGRVHVSFEDIRHFALHVLRHRAILNYDGQAENISMTELVNEICTTLPEEA
jgi:MoxR-like ATPase